MSNRPPVTNRCRDRGAPFGWRCLFEYEHGGPCGMVPRWWNLLDRYRFRADL